VRRDRSGELERNDPSDAPDSTRLSSLPSFPLLDRFRARDILLDHHLAERDVM